MFKAFIGIQKGQTDNVRKVCEDIKNKDATFTYDIMKTTLEAKDKEGISLKDKFENLVLYSSTLDDVNKRAGWFIHKCTNAKLADYFWVKTNG